MQAQRIAEQLLFINESLASVSGANRPTWLFVSGHYPIYSSGDHGDTRELSTTLLPLLEHYQVDAYFCGHDHISEHLRRGDIDYFVAGAGAMTDSLKRTSAATLVWYGTGYSAFAAVNVSLASYRVEFVDTSNARRYSHVVPHPSTLSAAPPTSSPSAGPTELPSAPPTSTPSADNNLENSHSGSHSSLMAFVRANSRAIVVTGGVLLGLCALLLVALIVFVGRRNRAMKYSSMVGGQVELSGLSAAEGDGWDEESRAPMSSADNGQTRSKSQHSRPLTIRNDNSYACSDRSRLYPQQQQQQQQSYSERWAATPDSAQSSAGSSQRDVEAELRLKLFDVIASTIREEASTEGGAIAGGKRAGATAAAGQQHKRAATMAV